MAFVISDGILGLSLTKFLLHLLNFAILFTCLWLILYKPVMKFIRERQARIQKEKEDAEQNLKASEEARAASEERLRVIDEEIEQKRISAEKETQAACDKLLADAESRAEGIVRSAEEKARKQTEAALAAAKSGIKDAAVTLAESILAKKVEDVDDDLIDAAVKDWKNG